MNIMQGLVFNSVIKQIGINNDIENPLATLNIKWTVILQLVWIVV